MSNEDILVARLFLDDLGKGKEGCNEIETLKKALDCYEKAREEYEFFSKSVFCGDKNVAQILGLVLGNNSTAN